MTNRKTKSKNSRLEFFWVQKFLKYLQSIDLTWLTIWGIIYVSFIILDILFQIKCFGRNVFWDFMIGDHIFHIQVVSNGTFIGVTILKFIGIVLNVFYVHKKFPKDHLLQIALLFTFLSDTILIFDNVSIAGILTFCFAQYFHIARFANIKPKAFFAWTLFLVLILMFGNEHGIPDIYVLGFIYASNLLGNLILSRRWWIFAKQNYFLGNDSNDRKRREVVASTCAFFGFFLFVCCDLNVVLSFFSRNGFIPQFFYVPANFLAWFFYYPSQVLIANSSMFGKRKQVPLEPLK